MKKCVNKWDLSVILILLILFTPLCIYLIIYTFACKMVNIYINQKCTTWGDTLHIVILWMDIQYKPWKKSWVFLPTNSLSEWSSLLLSVY